MQIPGRVSQISINSHQKGCAGQHAPVSGDSLTVTGNTSNGNVGTGIIVQFSTTGDIIKSNTASGNAQGMQINDVTGAQVSFNNTSGNIRGGFSVVNMTTACTFTSNTSSNNGDTGIAVANTSTGNTFTKNTALNNGNLFGRFDLEDDSTGSGTGGTANTWTKNVFVFASPNTLA